MVHHVIHVKEKKNIDKSVTVLIYLGYMYTTHILLSWNLPFTVIIKIWFLINLSIYVRINCANIFMVEAKLSLIKIRDQIVINLKVYKLNIY